MVQLTLVALMLGQTPSLTVTAPTASSDVVVGTTFNITWDAVITSDVKIELTTDDGTSWSTITDTVDDSQSGWRDFPWQPPNVESATCRIRISEYLGGTPSDESETFEIRRPATGVNDDEGGCAAAPGSALAVLVALALRRRRR
jgi:hypothetical protein